MPKPKTVPAYRLRKASGQARVIINAKHSYLSPFGSAKSKELYAGLVAEQAISSAALPACYQSRQPSHMS